MGILSNVNNSTSTGRLPSAAAGMWNPETTEGPEKEGQGTFGLHPYITIDPSEDNGATEFNSATYGFSRDLWSLTLEKLLKNDANKGKLDITFQNSTGKDMNGGIMLSKDMFVSLDFDSYMRNLWEFKGGSAWKKWIGDLQGRLILNGQCGYNVENQIGRLGTSMSSLTIGLADPLNFGSSFSPIKYEISTNITHSPLLNLLL